jgi:hypothetical protein
MKRSCAPAARSTEALCARSSRLVADSSSRAARVSSSSRALSSAMAACAASEPSSATSERSKVRSVRSAAYRTPITWDPRSSGTPRMATSPSSRTPPLMSSVCRKRVSVK